MINDKTDLVATIALITMLAAPYWIFAIFFWSLFASTVPSFGLLWWLANLASMATFFYVELSENRAAKARRLA